MKNPRIPPMAVRNAFARGIALYERGYGGAGLRPQTVKEARSLAAGRPVTVEKARRMRAWLARHGASENEARKRLSDPTSPAAVAWLLWGANPAIAYSKGAWRDPVAAWLRAVARSAGLASVK